MDITKVHKSVIKILFGFLLVPFCLAFGVYLSNILNLKNKIQFEFEKIELVDNEFENNFVKKRRTEEVKKVLIISDINCYAEINSVFVFRLNSINRPRMISSSASTPPSDFF